MGITFRSGLAFLAVTALAVSVWGGPNSKKLPREELLFNDGGKVEGWNTPDFWAASVEPLQTETPSTDGDTSLTHSKKTDASSPLQSVTLVAETQGITPSSLQINPGLPTASQPMGSEPWWKQLSTASPVQAAPVLPERKTADPSVNCQHESVPKQTNRPR